MWQEEFQFFVARPELALLRFVVEDDDFVGPKSDPFLGQATFSMDCLRPGFRSIPLLNNYSEPVKN
jgi:phosphatidylinositol phospholipase C gamma-1